MRLVSEVIYQLTQELVRARAKFPVQDIWVTLAALTEEVGELNQAVLQYNHEPLKGITPSAIEKEALQVMVMAARVILDCQPHCRNDLRIESLRSDLRSCGP